MAAAGGGRNTFTDLLVTIFSSRGLNQYQHDLRNASTAILGLSAQMSGLGAAAYPLFFAFYRAGPQVQFAAAAFLALTGVMRATNQAFVETEKNFTQLALAIGHSGLNIAAQDLRDYARERARATGIDQQATLALAEQLVNLRFTAQQVRQFLPLIQGAAIAGHGTAGGTAGTVNTTQVAANLAKAIQTGETAALINLGLDPEKVKKAADRTNEILRQMILKYQDNVEIMTMTLGVQQDRVNQKWRLLLEDLGALFEPLQRAWAATKGLVIDVLDAIVNGFRRFLAIVTFGLSEFGNDRAVGEIAERSKNWQSQSLKHLGNIDNHTKQFTTTFARMILGAGGQAIRDAANVRNFQSAVRSIG